MTQPPPSTPTPRRFLLSKRPQASQQQTPGGGPPVFAGSQRFQTTPRFAPPSTQRPPSTPVFPGALRPSRHRDPIHDALDSSPPDAPVSATRPALASGTQRHDRIEIDSDNESDSRYEQEGVSLPTATFVANDSIEIESEPPSVLHSDVEERTPKRRRISISPVPSWHHDAQEDVFMSHHDDPVMKADENWDDHEELSDAKDEYHSDLDAPHMEDEELSLPDRHEGGMPKTQPTFRRAPRFKVSDTETFHQEGLPEAFSPQRRGAKYVAGGLAAELQSWLAEVKGWTGGDRPADLVMNIVVDELRAGNKMYIVKGRRMVEDGEASEEIAARLMLAGEGRLTGLGQKAAVIVGSTVAISQPVWELVLDGSRWIVACDWSVS
ncbi:hypothetical protein LY78DRAFT_633849 [Colletotrichum sublineola]|uniref:Uncharacterized protein n=1 Tax=Colletotrichum sublineola TaxID=1173701 RepID=A0A066X6C0_COLSU|nr:hypothetical protein LY78DRAFT_633849 [Colletotrichum sublineola]KDN61575.1 hypothetical protein CSUB01_04169 [Colletotrichum sublineola]